MQSKYHVHGSMITSVWSNLNAVEHSLIPLWYTLTVESSFHTRGNFDEVFNSCLPQGYIAQTFLFTLVLLAAKSIGKM